MGFSFSQQKRKEINQKEHTKNPAWEFECLCFHFVLLDISIKDFIFTCSSCRITTSLQAFKVASSLCVADFFSFAF